MKHLDLQLKDFGQQFSEQVKGLESKVSVDSGILSNILDLYKRRAAIEQAYGDSLLKLTSSIAQRNDLENQKRPKWKNYSPVKVLHNLLVSTERTARAHKSLGHIYGKQMTQRIMDMQDDCSRLTKRSTEILQHRHLQILQSMNKLLVKQKIYSKLFNEADDFRRKADKALEQLDREVIRSHEKKKELDKNFKIKKLKEDYTEKFKAFKDRYIECTSARNKYIIQVFSLKEALNHFYSIELNHIIQCSQYGFHHNLTRLTMNHSSCEEALSTIHDSISNLFNNAIDQIDVTNDMKVFFEAHQSVFASKESIRFSPTKDDIIDTVIKIDQKVENDLKNMHVKFNAEYLNMTKVVSDREEQLSEISKSYNDLINQKDYDVLDYVCRQSQSNKASFSKETNADNLYISVQKTVTEPKLQKEISYFKLMEEYLVDHMNLIDIGSKLKNVKTVLSSSVDYSDSHYARRTNVHKQTAIMIGMRSKVFGGDLKKYCYEMQETVPAVVRSCIRLINVYGMLNMGVFRVPGSQYDVQLYKAQFDLGADPLRQLSGNTNDVNLAASLLKLYFRELEPPVFDDIMFAKIVEKYNSVNQNEPLIVEFMKEVVMSLDPAVYSTTTYLVSFLSHLSEFSLQNCMDIANLAIIFGPCLMPIPEDKSSQLFHFQAIINHITQCLISYRDEIFTKQLPGCIYEKDQTVIVTNESLNLEPRSVAELNKFHCFDDSTMVSYDGDLERKRKQSSVSNISSNTRSDDDSIFAGDFSTCKESDDEQWIVKDKEKYLTKKYPSISEFQPNIFASIITQESQLSEIEADNSAFCIRKDSDTCSLGCYKVLEKRDVVNKMSIGSVTSDCDLDLNDFNLEVDIPLEFADTAQSKSPASMNSIDVNQDPERGKNSLEQENDEKVGIDIVKIRKCSQTPVSPESTEFIDTVDDELIQTRRGLQQLEQQNVIKFRNTIHIDNERLASKFFSPFCPERSKLLTNDNPASSMSKPPASLTKPLNISEEGEDDLCKSLRRDQYSVIAPSTLKRSDQSFKE